jgi:hypothetical protein
MKKAEKRTYNFPSFSSLLGLLFIGLKLGHQIDWSWWWITSPLWIGPAVLLTIAVFLLIFAGICFVLEKVITD